MSGGIDYQAKSGFYAGTCLSNVDYGGDYNDYGVCLSKDGFGFTISKNDKEGRDQAATITYAVDFDL